MDIVFAGTPHFAQVALEALLDAGHRVRLVLTQPDRPAGRGRRLEPPPVKRFAEQRRLAVLQPPSLRDARIVDAIAAQAPEAVVVAAYGLLIPRTILELPPRGCLNIHASLLPRWRGAAPIQRALLAGDAQTGITIMQMDEGLDTGPILRQKAIPIFEDDTAGSLHDRLASLGARLLIETLASPCPPRPQGTDGITYAAKVSKEDAHIDWRQSAAVLERTLRAFDPAPGAYTVWHGEPLKLYRGQVEVREAAEPGLILAADTKGVVVACGEGALRVTELQRSGGRRLPAAAFLAGHPLTPGTRLG